MSRTWKKGDRLRWAHSLKAGWSIFPVLDRIASQQATSLIKASNWSVLWLLQQCFQGKEKEVETQGGEEPGVREGARNHLLFAEGVAADHATVFNGVLHTTQIALRNLRNTTAYPVGKENSGLWAKGSGEVEQRAQRRATPQKMKKVCLTPRLLPLRSRL